MIRNTDYCACLRFTLMTNTRITFFLSTYCNSLMKETKNSSPYMEKIGNSPLKKNAKPNLSNRKDRYDCLSLCERKLLQSFLPVS